MSPSVLNIYRELVLRSEAVRSRRVVAGTGKPTSFIARERQII